MTTTTSTPRLDASELEHIRAGVRGAVIVPGDRRYDEDRSLWNGAIDRRPAVIVRPRDASDVAAAVRAAREHGLPLSLRGGGHNVAGSALVDGGLAVHFGDMRAIDVAPASRRIRVEPGVTLGDLDATTVPLGLAVPAGIVTTTGVAGLTLGGGIGWLMRRHGLTVDRLRAVELVTADGRAVRASADEDPDLFWALRGGGGNFGAVTAFEFEGIAIPTPVTAGLLFFAREDARSVLRAYRDWAREAPRDVTTILILRTAPALPALPAAVHGRQVLVVGLCHVGDEAAAERDVSAIRELGPPIADTVARRPFTAHQGVLDASVPWGNGYHWKSVNVRDLTDTVVDVLVERSWAPGPPSYVIVFQLGGAVADVPPDATAFADRRAGFVLNVNGVWAPGAPTETVERAVAWTRETHAALAPLGTGAAYVNFLMAEGEERVRAAYGSAYERLAQVKGRWDPDNVFRANQNVLPAR